MRGQDTVHPRRGVADAGQANHNLTFESTGPSTISYDAIKVVIKLPEAGSPAAANPVVRRNEHCAGLLTR
jgi:hypothetical protein